MHTLGEVDIFSTDLLRVSSGTILPIFIEIGSYLTDREQKTIWHSFFWDTVYFVHFTPTETKNLLPLLIKYSIYSLVSLFIKALCFEQKYNERL